jgi:hypothetical protein
MKTNNLNLVQVSSSTLDWLKSKYTAVDAMNAETYRSFLAPECQLQFGNNPIARGRDDLVSGIKHFWSLIGGLDHSFINVLGDDQYVALDAMIEYKRKDGSGVLLPCVTTIERNTDGVAKFIKIFIDTAPIFSTSE